MDRLAVGVDADHATEPDERQSAPLPQVRDHPGRPLEPVGHPRCWRTYRGVGWAAERGGVRSAWPEFPAPDGAGDRLPSQEQESGRTTAAPK